MIEIITCSTTNDFSTAISITKDYIAWLNIDLTFQNIEEELSNFSSMYSPPRGLFLIAFYMGKISGGVGLREFEPKICEMKRLYVYDKFKGKGIGHILCTKLINEAKVLGYEKMRLDTLSRMKEAIGLYENLGFKTINPYRFNPHKTTKYMELNLRQKKNHITRH